NGGGSGSDGGGTSTSEGGADARGSTGTTGGMTSDGGAGEAGAGEDPCQGSADPRLVVAPQRILRLTMSEVGHSIGSLFGQDAAKPIFDGKYGSIGLEIDLAFPPLDSNREGLSIDDTKFAMLDQIASDTADYLATNIAALTGCAAPTTDDCAKAYL